MSLELGRTLGVDEELSVVDFEDVLRSNSSRVVEARVSRVLKLEPVSVTDWRRMDEGDLQKINIKLLQMYEACEHIDGGLGEGFAKFFNARENFFTEHLPIMHESWAVRLENDEYRDFLVNEVGLSFPALVALDNLHDAERFVFNGPYVPFGDDIRETMLARLFPKMPNELFHSIKMMTGEEGLPDGESIEGLSADERFRFLFKRIDSRGKIGERVAGEAWARAQVEAGRFPIMIAAEGGPEVVVEAIDYMERDGRCILLAEKIEQQLAGDESQNWQLSVLKRYQGRHWTGAEL